MLRDGDLIMELGRAGHGGDYLMIKHEPTGITRRHPGPLRDIDRNALIRLWMAEIEAELLAKGLTQSIE